MPTPLDQLTSALSGTYTFERELGGGGMSRVFLAEETRLRRKVVVKVLSPELAAGISAERFEREIQLAASLLQANIVPVLSSGESGGLPYYTMPFVEGESLRARLMRGQVDPAEVPGILRDVARALAFAHERGVVHRDIKPDNVLLSGGAAVVTDFGIAKAIAAARGPAGATLTQMGTTIGTPAYMAPEQAAGDPDIDHRADIYALGCMAYELLSGQLVFPNRTPQRMLAAHMNETPAPLSAVAPTVPLPLASLVMQCLEKDPARRPQSAREIVRVLDSLASGTSHDTLNASLLARPGLLKWALAIYAAAFIVVAVVAKAAIVGIGLPDWVLPGSMIVMALGLPVLLFTGYSQWVARRAALATPTLTPGGGTATQGTMATIAVKASPHLTWRRSAIGGAIAIGAFVLAIGVFMALRAAGIGPFGSLLAQGKLGNSRVLIGSFNARSTDTALANVVAEAVRADLTQSTALNVVSTAAVAGPLRDMQKAPNTKLDSAVAREVAQRSGIAAFVTGDIVGLGSGFVVNVRLVGADSGQTLASFSEVANAPSDLMPAIGKITKQLRSRAGESLKHLQNSPPLIEAMTPSLDAARKFTEGTLVFRAGKNADAIRLFDEAIAIDSNFAGAYRAAATLLGNTGGDPDKRLRYLTRAFQLADRLPEAERYQTRAVYYAIFDPKKAIDAYENLIRLRPTYGAGYNNVALIYAKQRDFRMAEQRLHDGIRSDSGSASFPFGNLVGLLTSEDRFAEADSVLRVASVHFPGHPMIAQGHSELLLGRRDVDSLTAFIEHWLGNIRDPSVASAAGAYMMNGLLIQGRLKDARRASDAVLVADRQAGTVAGDVEHAVNESVIRAVYENDRAGAVRAMDAAMPAAAALPVASRPMDDIAWAYALAGDETKAKAAMAEYRRRPSFAADSEAHAFDHSLTSYLDFAGKRYQDGVREARAADVGACTTCSSVFLAMNYEQLGQTDSAIVAYKRYVDGGRSTAGVAGLHAVFLTNSYKRLAELLESKGRTKEALDNYEMALRMWNHADPQLTPQVKQMQQAVDRLRKKGG